MQQCKNRHVGLFEPHDGKVIFVKFGLLSQSGRNIPLNIEGARILIVEDELFVAMAARGMIESHGGS